MEKNYLYIIVAICLLIVLSNCRKDPITTDPSAQLSFSADTVLFDTVFSTIGSTTQVLKVYNNNSERINISSIYIDGGVESQYRMNVDGINGLSHQNVEIGANDSLYIFVEVTIDPNDEFLPFLVEDKINFITNGNEQDVNLLSYGQNAYFHGSLDQLTWLSEEEEGNEWTWDNGLPHVIYGIVGVDSAATLNILPGTQIYVHSGSGLLVYKSELNIEGELGAEVCFQGDRLEPIYDDEPGQWGIELTFQFEGNFGIEEATVSRGGIWLFESTGSFMRYTNVKNSVIGLQVDTSGTNDFALEIENCKVFNCSAVGLLTQQGSIRGYNNLFANCGESSAQFTIGGKYQMDHCTFGNYWGFGNRQSPAFVINNYYIDVNQNVQVRPLVETVFKNCIMYGNNANQSDYNEFVFDFVEDGNADYLFDECLIDSDQELPMEHFTGCSNGQNPNFINPGGGDFDLTENLPVYMECDIPSSMSGTGQDIENVNRNFGGIAMGAYSQNEF